MIKFKPSTKTSHSNSAEYKAEMFTLLRLCGVDLDAPPTQAAGDGKHYVVAFVRGNLRYKLYPQPARNHNTVAEVTDVAIEVSPGEWQFATAECEPRPNTSTPTGKVVPNQKAIVESRMCLLPCTLSVITAAIELVKFMDRMEAERAEEIAVRSAQVRRLRENALEVKSVAGSLGLTRLYTWGNTYTTPFERLSVVMEDESGLISSATVSLNLPAKLVIDLLPALAELVEAATRAAEASAEAESDGQV